MSKIIISDLSQFSLAFPPDASSGLLKYLRSPDTISVELAQPQTADGSLDQFVPTGIKFTTPVTLGATRDELTVQPGLQGSIGIKKDTLFDPKTDDFGDSIVIPAGQACVSAGFKASLGVDLTTTSGDLQFGFGAGTGLTLTNYRWFETNTRITAAIQTLFQHFVIPGDLQDLEGMAPNAVATLEGTGSLKFSATANLLAVANPLVSLPIASAGSVSIKQGASISLGAAVTLTGGYQVRVRRLDGKKVQLGFEKKQGEDLAVAVSAKTQVSGGIGAFDLIPSLFKAISTDPVPDQATFGQQTGLTGSEIATIAAAIKAGIDRSLALALSGQLDFSAGTGAAFSYEIDLGALDDQGRKAVHAALDGDLEGLEGASLAGVTRLRSAFNSLREGKHILKVNLLGIFNAGSLTDLLRRGKLIVDGETGAITVADQATANRIGFTSDNFAKDSAKLRTVLASSVTLTAGYCVGGALIPTPTFTCGCWSFEYHQKTNRQNIQHYLHTVEALGLISPADASVKVSSVSKVPDNGFGPSTLHLESNYGTTAFRSMFLKSNGQPRLQEDYEDVGRDALAALLPPGDPLNDARRRPLAENDIWAAIREAGSWQNITKVLKDAGVDTAIAPVIAGDCDLILWWAGAMSAMAKAINNLSEFLAGSPAPDPENNTLKKLRRTLDDAMASVCKDAEPRFGEAWGLLVMARASGMQDSTTATLVSPCVAFAASRRHIQGAAGQSDGAAQLRVMEAGV
jgi:hypothetical protein